VALSALIFAPISADATLYVILLDEREIAIASDGKLLTVSGDNSTPVSTIKEKVIRLSPRLAFMCDGITEIDTTTVKIHTAALAKQLNDEYQSQRGSDHTMAELAGTFGQSMSERLNQLSPGQRRRIFWLRQQLATPGQQLQECMFAGRDADNKLKIETVEVFADSSGGLGKYFGYHVDESIVDDSPHLILSGDVTNLKAAFENSLSPLGSLPSFQRWRNSFQSSRLSSEATAEALVDLAIKYSPQFPAGLIGYPIYVYRLDATGGLTRLRVVSRGHAVPLPINVFKAKCAEEFRVHRRTCGANRAMAIAFDLGRPDLDLVEPGRVSEREVKLDSGMLLEEVGHRRGLVCWARKECSR